MTNTLIGIAAGAGIALIGVVWAMLNARVKNLEDCKVDKAWCKPTHDAMTQSLARIEKQIEALDIKLEKQYNGETARREQRHEELRKGGY